MDRELDREYGSPEEKERGEPAFNTIGKLFVARKETTLFTPGLIT